MKITKKTLKNIIKEELDNVQEVSARKKGAAKKKVPLHKQFDLAAERLHGLLDEMALLKATEYKGEEISFIEDEVIESIEAVLGEWVNGSYDDGGGVERAIEKI